MTEIIDKIVLASGNQGKINEFNHLLSALDITVVAQKSLGVEDVPETGTTFIENAIIKARHASAVTGLPALADDSGLVVDALEGAPGIYSSRYAGAEATDQTNIDKLLDAMSEETQRAAYFTCVLVFMRHQHDPSPIIAQGRWHGTIAKAPAGQGGFGYDPVFFCPKLGRHAAELSKEDKALVSHRALALAQLMPQIEAMFGGE